MSTENGRIFQKYLICELKNKYWNFTQRSCIYIKYMIKQTLHNLKERSNMMKFFDRFYLDKEKDIIVYLYK